MKLLKNLAGAATVLAGITLAAGAAYAQEFTLKFQSSDPAGSPTFQIQSAWAETIKDVSGGRVELELLPVDAVVGYRETQDAVSSGILDGHITDMSYWAGKDAAFALLGNPVGAWSSPEEMLRFFEFGGGLSLANELQNPYGLQVIGVITPGLEAFASNKPLNGVDDLKGLKMRAPEGLVQQIFAAAGAAPVNLPFSEVFTSLDKGVIDAADATVFSGNHEAGLHDVALHPVYPGFHSMPTIEVAITKATWDKMPADLQAIMQLAVRELAFQEVNQLAMKDLKAVADAVAKGVSVTNWPAAERARFRTIATGEWTSVASQSANAQKVYDTLVAYLNDQGLLSAN